jgi:integrase
MCAPCERDGVVSTQGSIRRDDSGRWFYVVDVAGADGKRRQLRKRGFSMKREAQEELAKVIEDMRTGAFVRPSKETVRGYLNAWIKGLPAAGRRATTIDGYRQLIEFNVLPVLGGIQLQALRATDLDTLYSNLLDRGLAMSTVRKLHMVLHKALRDAERKGLAPQNAARFANAPVASATKAPEMKFWTPPELRQFLDSHRTHHHFPLLRLAAMSGLRRGELCGLRWSDVDLDAGTISVRQAITVVRGKASVSDVKSKRSRRVLDIDAGTIAVLRALRKTQLEQRMLMGAGWAESGLVFTMPTGEGWHPDTISQAFDRLVSPGRKMTAEQRDALPPRIRLHDVHARRLRARHAGPAGAGCSGCRSPH